MNQTSTQFRILGVVLCSRGFGYAVMEGENTLHDFGRKRIYGDRNKGTLAGIQQVIDRNEPDVLVLQDVSRAKGISRIPRVKELTSKIVALAKRQNLKVVKISGRELRARLLGNDNGTKHEMAVLMAHRFPDELASRLPTKRRLWENEDPRMDFFDAVGLTVVFWMNEHWGNSGVC